MATPAAASHPSPPEATQAPPATPFEPPPKSLPLSPNAPPFFPAETAGRTKATRWSSESDSDDESVESLEAVLRGSPAPVDMEG